MTRVEVIETEITKLSIPELTQLRKWFMAFDSDEWDAQIEKDAVSGKLDALANEALEEYAVEFPRRMGKGGTTCPSTVPC